MHTYVEVLETLPDAVLLVDTTGTITFANTQIEQLVGYPPRDLVGQPVHMLVPECGRAAHTQHVARYVSAPRRRPMGTQREFSALHRDGHTVPVDIMLAPRTIDGKTLTLCVIRDLTARQALEDKLRTTEARYRHLVEHASDVFYRVDIDGDAMRGAVTYLSPRAETLTGHSVDDFARNPRLWAELLHPNDLPTVMSTTQAILASGEPGTREYRIRHRDGKRVAWIEDRVVPERDARGVVAGYHGVARDITERWWMHHRLRTMATLGAALRDCRGRQEIIGALLDALPPLFEANGVAFVSRATEDTVTIEQARGALASWTGHVAPTRVSVSAQVIDAGRMFVTNSAADDPQLKMTPLPAAVTAYASVPVKAERTVGALVVTKATSFMEAETTVLEAVGQLAAMALQRQGLHEEVVQKAADLETAYESTIEGWARALDMRDRITTGHTHRVTELTLRLAQALGVPAEQLPHVRRGAMLHDIGKMAIPDAILQKKGPLTPEERAVMQKHTAFAADMLGPIAFLQPAMQIPLYHHERWDGRGYPNGLKGEAIPLLARIFAVADVYDAITSERPYAASETHEAAMAFITSEKGRHFDPNVVTALEALAPVDTHV